MTFPADAVHKLQPPQLGLCTLQGLQSRVDGAHAKSTEAWSKMDPRTSPLLKDFLKDKG